MAEITSLTITYEGNNVWSFQTNLMVKDAGASFYDGTWNEDLVTFKTDNGGILLNNIPYDIIEYVDSIDSGNNFTPTSAKALIVYLKSVGFFDKSIGDGSGANTFLELGDTFSNYFGRALQVLRVNAGETGVESFAAALVQRFTDLLDTPNAVGGIIGFANRNKIVAVNNNGTALVYINNPLQDFTIPIPDFGVSVSHKGYQWVAGDLEINQSSGIEVGDFCSVTLYINLSEPNDGVILIPSSRYKGGNQLEKESFEYNHFQKIALPLEPDAPSLDYFKRLNITPDTWIVNNNPSHILGIDIDGNVQVVETKIGNARILKIQAVGGSLQSDELIGATILSFDVDGICNVNWENDYPDIVFDNITGEVSGITTFPDSWILFHFTKSL